MTEQTPQDAPKPGFLRLAVTMFENELVVGVAEARQLLHQGLVRDRDAAQAAISEAEAGLGAFHASQAAAAPTASAPAPKVSASGQATPPAGEKPKETP